LISVAMLTKTCTLEGLKNDHVFTSRIEHSVKNVDEIKSSGLIRHTIDLSNKKKQGIKITLSFFIITFYSDYYF